MTTIFIPVDVPEDDLNALLDKVISLLPGRNSAQNAQPAQAPNTAPVTPVPTAAASTPVQQPAQPAQLATQGFPAQASNPPWAAATPAQNPVATAPAAQQWPSQPPAPAGGPECQHGQMHYIKAGVSSNGRAYQAFYACPQPRNAPDKCQSVQAQ